MKRAKAQAAAAGTAAALEPAVSVHHRVIIAAAAVGVLGERIRILEIRRLRPEVQRPWVRGRVPLEVARVAMRRRTTVRMERAGKAEERETPNQG